MPQLTGLSRVLGHVQGRAGMRVPRQQALAPRVEGWRGIGLLASGGLGSTHSRDSGPLWVLFSSSANCGVLIPPKRFEWKFPVQAWPLRDTEQVVPNHRSVSWGPERVQNLPAPCSHRDGHNTSPALGEPPGLEFGARRTQRTDIQKEKGKSYAPAHDAWV